MNALYRPGPIAYIPQFIKRKHGEEPIEYDLPCMEKYLKDTYGITVYQEQVMLLSREIAKKIEDELEYPGQIKINMIRETRAVEYAK